MRINSTQIRAARAVPNWSQNDLAQASKLSIATVRKIELGLISPRYFTMDAIHESFSKLIVVEAQKMAITARKPTNRYRLPTDLEKGALKDLSEGLDNPELPKTPEVL